MALPQESRGRLEAAGADLLYTGVGKVNAAWALTRRLTEIRLGDEPLPWVLNMGTAGSRTLPAHTVAACNRFTQRDMDVSGLGFAPGTTPFDPAPAIIEFPAVLSRAPQYLCSTADSFATHRHEVSGDVVDMEAFALARVCLAEAVRFGCIKYVTDGADSDSAPHWEAALESASRAFERIHEELSRD